MTLLNTLQDEMKSAMKTQDKARLNALRLMVSAIRYVEVDSPNLSDEAIIEVLKKEAKKRREAIEAYKAAGRTEQASQEEYELKLIEEYLPKMMGEEEVRQRLTANGVQLAAGMNMGEAMKIAMKVIGKDAEGGLISKVVKELLAK